MASEWLLINHLGVLLESPAWHFRNGRGCTVDLNSGGSALSKDLVNEGLCKLFLMIPFWRSIMFVATLRHFRDGSSSRGQLQGRITSCSQ